MKHITIFLKYYLLIATTTLMLTTGLSHASVNNDIGMEQAVLKYINEYRQKHWLKPLKMNAAISNEARTHSQDMARHVMGFGHQGFSTRIKHLYARIPNARGGAENVAYNYKTAQIVVAEWVKSPGHHTNIVGNYDLTGIGIARDSKGKLYFTQMFIKSGSNR